MSGHSKFANIKHKKEKNDAAKGKIFSSEVSTTSLLLTKDTDRAELQLS